MNANCERAGTKAGGFAKGVGGPAAFAGSIGRGAYPLESLDKLFAVEAAQLIKAKARDCIPGEPFRGAGKPLAIGAYQPLFGNGVVHLPAVAMQSSLEF